jgi:pSer/pThr/pTyr-binding forkhead associated (FHA) protein
LAVLDALGENVHHPTLNFRENDKLSEVGIPRNIPVITLNLLHPIELVPVQSWNFTSEPEIYIGRANDNHVILYSSVVSRRHLTIQRQPLYWEVINNGANGTFVDGKPIDKMQVVDGMIIRLATTGPKLQIRIDDRAPEPLAKKDTVGDPFAIPPLPKPDRATLMFPPRGK